MASHRLSGVYLVSDLEGYTNVFSGKNHCVEDILLAFLLDGALPSLARYAADENGNRES